MNMPHDPSQLFALDALLDTRSVSAAARRMGVTQSAMSHTLARLRLQLDDPLLVRAGRALALTARAELIAPRLRAAVRDLQAAVAVVPTFDPATATRTFRLATTDLGELAVLPALLRRLEEAAPGVDLWVRGPAEAEVALQRDELDLSIQPLPTGDIAAGLRTRSLYRERFVCVYRRDHPLATAPLTVEAFAGARHALVAPRGARGGVVDTALGALGLTRRTALLIPNFLVVPHLVASTELVVTLPSRLAEHFAALLPLCVVEHPLTLPGFTMSMVWHERHEDDPGHRWLRGCLLA